MKTVNRLWLKGLIAAAIAGSTSSVANAVGAMTFDPEHFNFAEGIKNLIGLVGLNLLMGGLIGVSAYLKQSPLPPDPIEEAAAKTMSEAPKPESEAPKPESEAPK